MKSKNHIKNIGKSTSNSMQTRRCHLIFVNIETIKEAVMSWRSAEQYLSLEQSKHCENISFLLGRMIWNINLWIMFIILGALGIVPKTLVSKLNDVEIRARVETIHTTALLGLHIYWEGCWRFQEIFSCSVFNDDPHHLEISAGGKKIY